jgi:type II secretory pathway pseudopilin PulG
VVIAIIGVLIALLLPAVQAAREAARRMSCSNNIKQLSLAMHNYHDVNNVLPFGVRGGTYGTFRQETGTNWRVSILPFIEQTATFQQLSFAAPAAFSSGSGNCLGNPILTGLVIQTLACPSCYFKPIHKTNSYTFDTVNLMFSNYVGIGGSCPDPNNNTNNTLLLTYGTIANNGVLTINTSRVLADLTDGTSNVLIIGEQSAIVGDGAPHYANYGGAWAGVSITGTFDDLVKNGGDFSATGTPIERAVYLSGVTYVHFGINDPSRMNLVPRGTTPDPNEDVTSDYRALASHKLNTLISSAHPGGAQLGVGDGSVRFFSETMKIESLRQLCSMNDGLPVSAP